ncbi:ABC-type exporter [Nitzschia inconspicua]|uniref:ABC-type exporter n=1 Tax=Nitzschia inconspicua TaxID=303405 RepID=A0A9K3PQF5_9STRA|nr:ABC-type exporter [Nitzschia inconspicua]
MSPPASVLYEDFFGIPVSTFRDRDVPFSPFPHEMIISAISILFFRTTIHHRSEPSVLTWFFGLLLAFLAYCNKSYELLSAVEIFSYMVPMLLFSSDRMLAPEITTTRIDKRVVQIILIALGAILSLLVCHFVSTGALLNLWYLLTPTFVQDGLALLFPIHELEAAYRILDEFILEDGLLQYQVARLFFVTFHIQVGIGYLGIDFLKREQERRNQLVRMDMSGSGDGDDKVQSSSREEGSEDLSQQKAALNKKARQFQRTAAPFIFFTAVPYMIRVIGYGNLNAYAYACFKDDVHRAIRLYDLFEHDNNLVALSEHSAKAPADFAGFMDTIVSTSYDLFNRKLFSLPKVLLLPMVMARQPKMIAQIFPIIFFTDWLKGRAVSYMTQRIEHLNKEKQDLSAIRSKVEQFDMKNAELLQRAGPGATEFTRRRWQELTVKVQMKSVVTSLITRTKGFFAFIQRNFVFSVLVDCALAQLMAAGKLVSADIFVFSRAIEDAVDMVLMRSRSEAELARMMTQIENLKELSEVWSTAQQRNFLPCNVVPPDVIAHAADGHSSLVVLRNLVYSRGTALVRIDHLELTAGIYALTGANGSGKSTLFRLLMGCNTNDRPVDIPPSIVLSTPMEPLIELDDIQREVSCEAADEQQAPLLSSAVDADEEKDGNTVVNVTEAHPRLSITMPSSHVVEISQTFYWPLYARPIDWIYHEDVIESLSEMEVTDRSRRVAELLNSLEFSQSLAVDDDNDAKSEYYGLDNSTSRLMTGDATSEDESAVVASSPTGDIVARIMEQLVEEKEDWFSDLSGGQKSKVELVRKVFLLDECPQVLLIDETMAPLDPRSKSLVMSKIKSFCSGSVVIVIYHTDVGREQEAEEGGGELVECVPSNDFFDGNIHVENKMMFLRPVC